MSVVSFLRSSLACPNKTLCPSFNFLRIRTIIDARAQHYFTNYTAHKQGLPDEVSISKDLSGKSRRFVTGGAACGMPVTGA
jgi:hypothetical protein